MLELAVLGEGATFHHIGIATHSIKAILGENAEIFRDEVQEVAVSFAEIHGIKVEFIEPLSEESPISQSLKKNHKLVHLCFQVPNIAAAIEKGRKNGLHCISKPVPAVAFQEKRIAWLYSKSLGLIEIVEK